MRLDEVEVGGQGAGREEAHLHGPLLAAAGDLGPAPAGRRRRERKASRLALLARGEGQLEEVGGRVEGGLEEAGEGELGHGLLVGRDGQAALGDVEDALGGAPVVRGVVEDAVAHPVGGEGGRDVLVRVGRQGELAGHAVAVEDEGVRGQAGQRLRGPRSPR